MTTPESDPERFPETGKSVDPDTFVLKRLFASSDFRASAFNLKP
ncbi:hypothetical protein [Alistipes sp. An66]|nr:hypothetical protein [Alistipes sp. An66]